jgi:hypothetical protein
MDKEGLGQRLVELATQRVPPGWELPRKRVVFDCFGVQRRALAAYEKDISNWENEGGR